MSDCRRQYSFVLDRPFPFLIIINSLYRYPVHETTAGEKRKPHQSIARDLSRDSRALQKAARAPAARREAERLQGEAEKALAEAGGLKLQARLEDLTVWQIEKVKQSRKGSKTYTYWMASWREGGKTRRRRECQEDRCRGGQAEGQEDEGGGDPC